MSTSPVEGAVDLADALEASRWAFAALAAGDSVEIDCRMLLYARERIVAG